MDFEAAASTWMPSPPHTSACCDLHLPLCDIQSLTRSSVGASEYSLSVLSELFKPFMRYRGNTQHYPNGRDVDIVG